VIDYKPLSRGRMFRVLEIDSTGKVAVTIGEERVAPPPDRGLRWVDLEAQDASQLAVLADRFKFHPLTIEDCSHFDQRPKLEGYGDYLFLVTHGFRICPTDAGAIDSLELHTFLGDRYLVTVHAEPIPALEAVWKRVEGDAALLRRGTDFVSYLICDAVVDTFFPLLDEIAEKIEDIEDALLGRTQETQLTDIFKLKRSLVTLRKVISPQRDVFALIAKRGEGRIAERTTLYFRDVYDHLLRIHEAVEAARDLLGNALDAYLWSASQRTNEIMKRLTLLSAVFLPLTFITGFFGQNFTHMPYGSKAMLAAMLLSCALVPAGMTYFFLRSKWF
jgi:magnesium transporter